MAIEELGEVLSTYIAPVGTSGIRHKREFIELKEGYGILDDKFAKSNLDKSVMIVGSYAYSLAHNNSIELPKGALGENILLNFDPHILKIGDRLLIRDVVLEVTEPCTLCSHLTKYSSKLPKLILNHRGIYCKIIRSGKVFIGDKVEII